MKIFTVAMALEPMYPHPVDLFMDDPRIIELLSEMLNEQKQTNARLDRLEQQQQTTNLKLQELVALSADNRG